ncbi:GNAT family N-acetyltransferase [Oceanicola sp. 22II-s10i]|uniref:GNAT family N-acetyltransferase n=1 Tax=Oceanicola sp. 22II-s10i TaxID=1317116 RepID=UPI001C3C70EC|nr:GNAT family N-acetyltransferase [Oceanicola sp. 22II-s10i]
MNLVIPTRQHLPDYLDALQRGWSPDNLRPEAAQAQIAAAKADPEAFLARFDDRSAEGPPIVLPDGSTTPRLPGFQRWIWQDGFCGTIGLRWQPGTEDLPPTCLGHIGYAVVPWRRDRGFATAALAGMLPGARSIGLRHVDLTTAPENAASIRVIEKCGGVLVERFDKPAALGGGPSLRFRIELS